MSENVNTLDKSTHPHLREQFTHFVQQLIHRQKSVKLRLGLCSFSYPQFPHTIRR